MKDSKVAPSPTIQSLTGAEEKPETTNGKESPTARKVCQALVGIVGGPQKQPMKFGYRATRQTLTPLDHHVHPHNWKTRTQEN